jgi:nucleoside 2-deoxyribosyltransferase
MLAFVAGPYRGKTWGEVIANVGRAADTAAQLLRMGHSVICPHTMTHTFEMYDLPDEVFLRNGLEQLRRCDALCIVDGAGGKHYFDSEGTMAEVELARELGIPCYYGAASVAGRQEMF